MNFREYRVMYEAEDRHWWYRGMRAVMFRMLDLKGNSARSLRILDAGCGTGGTLHALDRAGYSDATGFDLSPIALQFSQKRHLRRVIQSSITQIPFESNTFDIVVSSDVITDARTHNEALALAELFRVLKPGGRLFLNLPALRALKGEHDRAVSVAHRETRPGITGKLTLAGFRVKRATYWNMFLLPAVFLVRLYRSGKQDKSTLRSDIVVPPPPVNFLLSQVLRVENVMIKFVDLPLGSSVAVVAIKPRNFGVRAAKAGASSTPERLDTVRAV